MAEKISIEETRPWKMSNVVEGVGVKPYAIGCIISEKIGGVIVDLHYDGKDMQDNIAKVKTAGDYICACVNEK